MLSSPNLKLSIQQFQQKTKTSVDQFLRLYHTKHGTLCMHACMHGQICSFTQQGPEKLNNKTTKDYFWSTNQRGLDTIYEAL